MANDNGIVTLEGLLDRIEEENRDCDRVSVRGVIEAVGGRSFGPLLLVPGLIGFSPLSGIPGVSTTVGVMVFLICGQLLIGRRSFWLPDFILRRSIPSRRFQQAVRIVRKGARVIDRMLKPRLSFLVDGVATYFIAICCLLMALFAPFMEILPFAITGVGAVITCLSFGLLARDGLLILVAFFLCIGISATGLLVAS